jgi:hypothetical protein
MAGQVISLSVEGASGQLIKVLGIRGKEDISELLALLIQTENKVYPLCDDYISKIRRSAEKSNIGEDIVNESWRRKLCEWCYEVTDHFKCKIEMIDPFNLIGALTSNAFF